MAIKLADGRKDQDRGMSNHSSGMSGEEMLALAGTIINIPGLKTPEATAHWVWHQLSKQLQTGTVWVTKGIHEKDRMHFNVVIDGDFRSAFEIFVKLGAIGHTVTSPANANGKTANRILYKYQVRGASVFASGILQNFPSLFTFGTTGIDRRPSFSFGNSTKAPTKAELKASNATATQ